MQRADIEAEVAAKFIADRLQNAAVAAVTVDDQEIARRQRTGDLACGGPAADRAAALLAPSADPGRPALLRVAR